MSREPTVFIYESYLPHYIERYCKTEKKHCLYLSLQSDSDFDDIDELRKAAPYLTKGDCADLILQGWLVVECESLAAMNKLFEQTIGDDGPTDLNKYNGKHRIYALTIGPKGSITENT